MSRFKAKIIPGHHMASGQNGNPKFPGGTIRMQMPFFRERGLDLSPYFPGTLNASIAPLTYRPIRAGWTFADVKWHPVDPAETFSFFHIRRVQADGSRVEGLVYYPHPETKPCHFQPPDVLELLFPKMDDIAYGMELELEADECELSVSGPDAEDAV